MKYLPLILICTLPLSACAASWQKVTTALRPKAQTSSLQRLTVGGQSAAALDAMTPAQVTAARTAPVAGRVLGVVSVALGSPADQGLWLKSALVQAPALGRAVLANGQGVAVELRPGTGGATMSLSAYRALGLGLTDLPQVQVVLAGP